MSLAVGSRLGAYEITGLIGAGGMGQVWRATDTTLGRRVALKSLDDAFAQDPGRLTRLEREARALAALNHPNIAQIYGGERSGHAPALVMELVEGTTLADRTATEPLPLAEALPIARQIVEALEAAHEQGIVRADGGPGQHEAGSDSGPAAPAVSHGRPPLRCIRGQVCRDQGWEAVSHERR